jgi:hypothetical protein
MVRSAAGVCPGDWSLALHQECELGCPTGE